MRYQCAGCGALAVDRDEVFCKGCQWTITDQYKTSVVAHLSAKTAGTNPAAVSIANVSATIRQPKIGFTTNPYFEAAV